MEVWAAYEGESWADVARRKEVRDGMVEVAAEVVHKRGKTNVAVAAAAVEEEAATEVVVLVATEAVGEL